MQNKPIETIFVCEFITCGGLIGSDLSPALLAQGQGMLAALLHDLSSLSYQVMTTVDARLTPPKACYACHLIDVDCNPWDVWESQIRCVDAVWLIAPETDHILAKLTALAMQYDKKILGSGLSAVEAFSTKSGSYAVLKAAGIHVIDTFFLPDWPVSDGVKMLAKPDDGAGCEATVCFDRYAALVDWLQRHSYVETHVIQAYIAGTAASISCVMNRGKAYVLSCNQQLIAKVDQVLTYQGCIVNGLKHYWEPFSRLANQIAQSHLDLAGYVGIDVIVCQQEDGVEKIIVVEINPRLTTSYMALQTAIANNPAALILNCLTQQDFDWPPIERNEVLVKVAHA